ncbi:MAG: XrtA/PEP-CTERM system amidotransferase [Pseudomonadota bacterium]
MCGIVGIFDHTAPSPIDEGLLRRMNDLVSHRGPDDDGFYVAPGVGLGHRRLSIIDLAGGHQPQFNEDGSVAIVFNGEIFNYQELARELKAAGHQFATNSDTEVIVHGWEQWGPDCVTRLRGQFAFAIWDSNQNTLFLARDRLGIKPLYYAPLADGRVLFGSELKSLLACPDLPRVIDTQATEDYFAYGYVPDPKTIYRHVFKLAPGHVLKLRRGDGLAQPKQYWDVTFGDSNRDSEQDICHDLIERLREAVKIRLISDVPLGAFLSGGVDSSAVVAMMADVSPDPVETFSIGFGDASHDESRFAALMAERCQTQHHLQQVDPDSFDLVDRLANFYDEPFADSSAMPTYRVSALARQNVTVALSGDGGDEIFAGYRRYRWHHYEEMVRSRLPDSVRGPLFGAAGRLYPKLDWAPKPMRAKSTLQALARDSVEGYFHSISVLNDNLRRRLYSPEMRRDLQGYHAVEVVKSYMLATPGEHHLDRVQYADLKTYLPGDILTKVDRASMAHSLEVRVPILDHLFVEWSAGLPPALRMKGHEQKYIFKKALEPHVPDDNLYRDKMGFAVPLGQWFRGPLREQVKSSLSGAVLADTGMFDLDFIGSLVDGHQSGLQEHSATLWSLVMFESFLRRVHGESDALREPAPVAQEPQLHMA